MAYTKKVTQSKFNAVKTLLNGGATVREVMEYMELSNTTVYMIKQAETLVEYENMIAEQALKDKQRAAMHSKAQPKAQPQDKPAEVVKEVRQTVTIQATHYMMEEMRKTNELLTCISAKLAFIVDELCGTPQKKE